MVLHEGIRDRADHAGGVGPESGVEFILNEDNVGLAFWQGLVVHAVISGECEHGTGLHQSPEAGVDLREELGRKGRARRVLVLDVVGQRQEHQVGAIALQQSNAGFEHEQREVHRVHPGLGHAHQRQYRLDAVFGHRARIGFLGGKADIAPGKVQPLAQLQAQLVLGGDGDDAAACVGELGQQRGAAQQLGAGHDHGFAGLSIQVKVARNTVHAGRRTGDDRHVVGAGEARHGAVSDRGKALAHEAGDVRNAPVQQTPFDVGRVAAIDAHHHHRPIRPAIVDAIERNPRPFQVRGVGMKAHRLRWPSVGCGPK